MANILIDFKNWIKTGFFTVAAGAKGLSEYRKIQKQTNAKVLFLTPDYRLLGINEDLNVIINHEANNGIIEGLDRLFFGSKDSGITTFTDTKGNPYVIACDNSCRFLDFNEIQKMYQIKSEKFGIKDLSNIQQIPKNYVEILKNLKKLNINSFGVIINPLELGDDESKNFSTLAFRVSQHTVFKTLSKLPFKTILALIFGSWFAGVAMSFFFIFVILMLYAVLKILVLLL